VYAALFCLEYKVRPEDIDIHLRIYQNDDIQCSDPEPGEIRMFMDRIVYLDKMLEKLDKEAA